jgi:catechol 2,3-dioxygenase-like lactoylglutathione lyase family enzyme
MSDSPAVALDAAAPGEAGVLSNLLELYAHDLSEIFSLEFGADGRFGYEKLPLYWSEPERRFPFLIRCGSRTVGFALTTRGSPASDDPDAFDVAEFFVLRRHREMARIWHAGWAESSDGARAVFGFSLASRQEVDARYAELTAAGYAGRQPPTDAFWGARFAIVRDPDGNDVGLMSPADPAKRFTPRT